MRPVRILSILLLVLALLPATVTAAAVEDAGEPTATATPTVEVEDATTAIDNVTSVVSARYDRDTGTATLVIESKINQRVVVTDAGGVFEGGEITRKTTYLQKGKNTVRLSVTEIRGNAAVTVDTGRTLYGIPVKRTGANPLEKVRATSAWIGGVVIAVSMFVLAAWREMKKEHGEPVSGWEAV